MSISNPEKSITTQKSEKTLPEEYGLNVDYDFRRSGELPDGAVAATVKKEFLKLCHK